MKKKYLKLSYDLSINTPQPPGIPDVLISRHSSISNDGSNVYRISVSSHSGTHVDAPLHMIYGGLSIVDYRIDEFIYNKPCCIKIPLKESELVKAEHLENYKDIIRLCDFLLIETGFWRYRASDPNIFIYKNPGFSVEAAEYIRDYFKNIRALGLDSISLASMENLEEGLEAHKILFNIGEKKFLIYEDVNLNHDLSDLKQVIAFPWLIKGIDSAPCSILGITGQ